MKKRSPKFLAEQFLLPLEEPHRVIECAACGAHNLEFRRSGDDELYYRCKCGFESMELGKVSDISWRRLGN